MEHPTNLMMITGVLIFDEPVEFERLQEVVEKRLLRYPRFQKRIVQSRIPLAPAYWEKDPNFDIRIHLRRIALPSPGDQTALEELVSTLMSTPLDFTKPLWQFHLVEDYQGGSVLLARLHHTIADGIALMRVLLSLTDERRDAPIEVEEIPGRKRTGRLDTVLSPARTALRSTQALLHEGMEAILNPSRAAELARLGASGATALGKLALRSPDPKTVFKGELGVMKLAVWSRPIPLADVKAIGNVTGGTINDVLLTAMTGALRRYLQVRGERVDGLNFRAVVPVNLRPLDAPLELGNKFGLVFLSLPVGIEDTVDRLKELKRRMDELKRSPEAVVVMGLLNVFGKAPSEVEKLAVEMFGAKATAVMTNVPGPRHPIYLAGSRLGSMMFWVPQSGRLGMGVSIISYNGEVRLGVAVDAGLVPDPRRIIEGFHDEFEEMLQLVHVVKEEAPAAEQTTRPAVRRCQGITQSGEQCRNRARPGSDYCHLHQSS